MTPAAVMASSYEDYCQQIRVIGKHTVLEKFQDGLMSANHLWMKSLPHFSMSCPLVPLPRFRNLGIP